MSKINLDLKMFEHVSTDKGATTLRHKTGGHTLTLAHEALSKEAQSQLKELAKSAEKPLDKGAKRQEAQKMAEGGFPGDEYRAQKPPHQESEADGLFSLLKAEGGEVCLANGKRHKLAAGGKVLAAADYAPSAGNKNSYGAQAPSEYKSFGDSKPDVNAKPAGLEVPPSAVDMPDDSDIIKEAKGGQVQKMASGGAPGLPSPDAAQAAPVRSEDPDIAANIQADVQNKQANQASLSAVQTMYNQKLAGTGAAVSQADMFGPNGEPPKNPVNPTLWNAVKNSSATEQLADKEIATRDAQAKAGASVQAQQAAHDKAMAQNAVNAELGLPPILDPGAPQMGGNEQQAAGLVQPPQAAPQGGMQPPQGASPQAMPNAQDGMMRATQNGFDTEIKGIKEGAKAAADLGAQQAAIHEQKMQADKVAQETYQNAYNGLEAERQAHMKDIQQSHIDPNLYWKDHSRVASVLGMIIAGFNPTGNPNAAVQLLNHQMDQNIDAQKANLNSKQNLLAANLRQFGNLKDATDMTRIMQNDAVSHQLEAAASKAQGPMAKAAALRAIGPLQRQSAQLQFQIGIRQAMMRLSSGQGGDPSNTAPAEALVGQLQMMDPAQAKALAGRIVPGVGVSASQEVPHEAREQIIMRNSFDRLANRYMQFANKNAGSLNWATSAEGKAMAAELQGAFRNATNGGVFKESEQKFIEKLIPDDPTQFFAAIRTNPKIREIISSNQVQLNQLKQNWGLPVMQAPQANNSLEAAMKYLAANANSKDPQVQARVSKIKQLTGK